MISEIKNSVSKKVNYVIIGIEPGVSKLKKIKALGTIKEINEDILFEMIKDLPENSKPEEKIKTIKKRKNDCTKVKNLENQEKYSFPLKKRKLYQKK